MRVVHEDARTGSVRLVPESLDDLWHLHHLLEPGDLARALTARRVEGQDDKLRSEKREKRTMVLGVRVEEVEFQEHGNRLRVFGLIAEGPEDVPRGHHTLLVAPHEELTIVKARGLKEHHRERIREAVEAGKRPQLLLLALDDDEAYLAALRQYGVHEIATIRGRGRGKSLATDRDRAAARSEYFGDVLHAVRLARPAGAPLLIVGPGFAREEFLAFLRERDAAAADGVVTEPAGHAGRTGVQEALRRGVVERVSRDARVGLETRWVEEVLTAIGKGTPVAYGDAEVRRALDAGAVSRLLVTDEIVRGGVGEALLDAARRVRAEAHVVSTAHDAGERLKGLGGTAALLRYVLQPPTG